MEREDIQNANDQITIMEEFLKAAKSLVSEDQPIVIVNLGSRDGNEDVTFAKNFPKARIISFEPNPATYQIVLNTTRNYPSITPCKLAATDTEGVIDFYQNTTGNHGASSIFPKSGLYDYIENYKQTKIQVQSVRMDKFLPMIGVTKVDLLWADIQGAELAAFRGMGDLFNGVMCVNTEIEYKPMYSGQPLYDDIKGFMDSKGMTEMNKTCRYDGFWGDAIFVRK
jgi:FkbM family methyltransferase